MARPPVKSRQYFEAVEERLAQGTKQSEAINQVAEQLGLHRNVVRAGWYRYRRREDATPSAADSFSGHISEARRALEAARASLEARVVQAKASLVSAQAAYDDATRERDEKLGPLTAQLDALGQHSDSR
jgi:hypothetical protein